MSKLLVWLRMGLSSASSSRKESSKPTSAIRTSVKVYGYSYGYGYTWSVMRAWIRLSETKIDDGGTTAL